MRYVSVSVSPSPVLAATSSPPISADWGIAIAVLITGLGVVWKWGQGKDLREDAVMEARLAEYRVREEQARLRDDEYRKTLAALSESLRLLDQSQRDLLSEFRLLRGDASALINTTFQHMGKIQREGGLIMADARRHYTELNDRVVVLSSKIDALHERLDKA